MTEQTQAAGIDVQVGSTVSGAVAEGQPVKKIIVAVHGVGDQYTFATIQAVVNQFCSFYDQPAGVPLGNFHTGHPIFSLPDTYPREPFARLAFAEVYWARIPRTVVDEKHTLEESKKWAQTIVERLRLRWRKKGRQGGCTDDDFGLLREVLSEMVQTIAVVDRLCSLGERAGLFTFDLRKLLDDYLGDVQIVTEFATNRIDILQRFQDIMQDAHTACPGAEIYVVAHSEGTVVSLLAFLKAFREPTLPDWANSVKGFMTLGSPIDKHLVLWPELFGDHEPVHAPGQRIQWRNYYDHGDPIGFALDDVRAWMELHKWETVFEFPAENDHGFSRYPFPGKAHVDYWTDNAVFGHFISTVVGERSCQQTAPATRSAINPPADRPVKKWLSYTVPYVGVAALMFVAVYILFRAVVEAIGPALATPEDPRPFETTAQVFSAVARTSLVLMGVTVAARLPRLSRNTWLRLAGVAMAAVACAVYYLTAPDAEPVTIVGFTFPAGGTTVVLAAIIVILASTIGVLLPSWGVAPLIIPGILIVAGKVGWHIVHAKASDIGPLWPVFVAGAAFLYLWWLAALLFDLVAIWHWYIVNGQVLVRMDEILGGKRGKERRTPKRGASPARYAPQVQH